MCRVRVAVRRSRRAPTFADAAHTRSATMHTTLSDRFRHTHLTHSSVNSLPPHHWPAHCAPVHKHRPKFSSLRRRPCRPALICRRVASVCFSAARVKCDTIPFPIYKYCFSFLLSTFSYSINIFFFFFFLFHTSTSDMWIYVNMHCECRSTQHVARATLQHQKEPCRRVRATTQQHHRLVLPRCPRYFHLDHVGAFDGVNSVHIYYIIERFFFFSQKIHFFPFSAKPAPQLIGEGYFACVLK